MISKDASIQSLEVIFENDVLEIIWRISMEKREGEKERERERRKKRNENL